MLFNSYAFLLVFLPLVLVLWHLTSRWSQFRLAVLVMASFLFYGWNRWEFTLLLAVSTLVDYVVGNRLNLSQQESRRLAWLCVSLVTNLGLLGYFKYCGFLAESFNAIVSFLQTGHAVHVPDIVLPAGISFYTFQTLSYSIDIYRRQVLPAKSLLHFAAYVTMFPQLIAGPIVRYSDLESQLQEIPTGIDWPQIATGIWFFVIGMSQKILLADTLAQHVNPLLVDVESLRFFSAWYALLGYSGQLYFDFAGYSNMAIGLGLFLGFQFPANFDSPYKAVNIQDFWRRWHITLSTFLKDYLYIPLGGNRVSRWLNVRNLMLVMVLGGLWHGAGWTFVLWGAYHGMLLAIHAVYRAHSLARVPKIAAIALTFLGVAFGWLLFRSESLQMAAQWSLAVLGMHGWERSMAELPLSLASWLVLVGAFAVCWLLPNAHQVRMKPTVANAVALAILLVACVMRFELESPFLYFQF